MASEKKPKVLMMNLEAQVLHPKYGLITFTRTAEKKPDGKDTTYAMSDIEIKYQDGGEIARGDMTEDDKRFLYDYVVELLGRNNPNYQINPIKSGEITNLGNDDELLEESKVIKFNKFNR